jgi:Mlc titration factor MtfA (ptsG expression regulator)
MSLLIVGSIVVFIVWRFYADISEGLKYMNRQAAPVKARVLPTPQAYREILQKYFKYYQQLSPQSKTKFERKVTHFIYGNRFVPRHIDEVTLEAKVLIAASAVQLTFGLPGVYLRHFSRILVYPNDYYSSITKRYHKGEVNPRFGIIVLSWQSFVNGYITPDDAFNVGLHEMAHALRLESIIRNEEYDFFDQELLEKFDDIADTFCVNMQNTGARSIIRPYACANKHEFFSVAVENFFERPQRLQNELPQIYNILTRLLAQDPLNIR